VVDLGLAAAGRALEQDVLPDALVERRDDSLDGVALLVGESFGLRLAGERLALGGRRPLAPRSAALGSDERERPGGSRAVVVREPEREVDERRRYLVEQPADGRRLDPAASTPTSVTTPRVELRPSLTATTAPFARPSGDPVGEGSRERACGHERVDGGERHAPANVPGYPAVARTSRRPASPHMLSPSHAGRGEARPNRR
jgi:hypothetical protein